MEGQKKRKRWNREGESKKKRKVLATDATKCYKISDMFSGNAPGQSKTLAYIHTERPPHTPSMAS